ncbi:MAG TPA: hypothetical protein VFC54_10655 [Pseudolabrys sp.]|nr:hypothetical protein [Pseudolabrys sp.]
MSGRFVVALALLALLTGGAFAQQPPALRVAGTIESVDGAVLSIKTDKLGVAKVALTADTDISTSLEVGATPQADGSQRAIQVTVFAPVQRGLGDGHRPWDRPNSTMTNGAVAETVAGVEGPVLTVKYKDGEKKIIVPPEAVILNYVVGDRSELKSGAHVAIIRAVKKPDGSLEANRVNVGRGEVVPR